MVTDRIQIELQKAITDDTALRLALYAESKRSAESSLNRLVPVTSSEGRSTIAVLFECVTGQ